MNDDRDTSPAIPAPPRAAPIVVNARLAIYEEARTRVVVLDGRPFWYLHVDDLFARDLFIAQAQFVRLATAEELAEAFGLALEAVTGILTRFREGGSRALEPEGAGSLGGGLTAARDEAIARWHHEGRTVNWMAHRLWIRPAEVSRSLRSMGLSPRQAAATQPSLFGDEASGSETGGEAGSGGEAGPQDR